MKIVIPALAAAFIATVGASTSAQAALIDFSAVALCPLTCTGITYAGTNLGLSTALNLDGSTWLVTSVNTGDKSGLTSGDPIDIAPKPLAGTYGILSGDVDVKLLTPISKTWTGSFGAFSESLTTLTEINRGLNAIAFTFEGTVTGGVFHDSPVSMVLSLTQAGGPGNVVSASLTNAGAVPEPATWVMLALGFAGLGYAAVRRSAKDKVALAI